LRQPKTLAVVNQTLNGVASSRDEDKETAAHGIGVQYLAAHGRKTIDAAPKIHGLNGHQDPHVRSNLDHTP
jgi:hypothetical protein